MTTQQPSPSAGKRPRMNRDTREAARQIWRGAQLSDADFAKLNGTAARVRELASLSPDERRLRGYDLLEQLGASAPDLEYITGDDAQSDEPEHLPVLAPDLVAGDELFDRTFPPLKYVWDGLIALGHCVLLAGRPKSGKSWFLLQLAQAIDTGGKFVGRATKASKILYVALEDGQRRIHQRMHIRNWRPRATTFIFRLLPLDGDGIKQIRAAIAAGGYEIVIIDTLRAAVSSSVDENSNAEMGGVLNELAQLAHETETTIVVTHHTTKTQTEDPFDSVRGAGAIRGAYDLGLLIQRKQKEREALLCVESRDIEAEDMTISFEGATGWSYEGDASKLDDIRAGKKVVKALQQLGDQKTVEEIAQALNVTREAAGQQLRAAELQGKVVRESAPTEGKARKPKDLWSLAS